MGNFFSLSKSATTHWLDGSEWMLLIFGAILTVGIIGEIKHGMWGKPAKVFELIVLWGVLGEVIADGGIFLFSSKLQIISDTEVAVLAKETAETRKRAAELEKETVLLREQLRTQGSRAALLMEVRSQKLFEKLEPFRGQKVQVAQCGRSDNEVTLAVMSLMELLRARGWKVDPFNPFVVCTTGMRVIVRHNAPAFTRAAAAAIGTTLNELGLIPAGASPFTEPPEPKKSEVAGWNPPSADTVLVVVEIHP